MTPVEEVLRTWREAERMLDDLPAINPDHESVARAIIGLKSCYQALTDLHGHSADVIASSRSTVDATHALLDRVRSLTAAPVLDADDPAGG